MRNKIARGKVIDMALYESRHINLVNELITVLVTLGIEKSRKECVFFKPSKGLGKAEYGTGLHKESNESNPTHYCK